MDQNEMVLVEYVGKQPRKTDSVRPGSGRVWSHPGAVLEIPAREAGAYLAHPTTWRRCTSDSGLRKLEMKRAAEEIIGALPEFSRQLLVEIGEACRVRILELDNAPPPPADAGSELEQSYLSDLGDAGADGYFETRVIKVMAALREMDPKNDEHYTDGLPRADAVQSFCGMNATEQEIDEAYSRIYGTYPVRGAPGTPVETAEDRQRAQDEAIRQEEALLRASQKPVPGATMTPEPQPEPAAKTEAVPDLAERAGLALAEIDGADKAVLIEMATVFGLEVDGRLGVQKLREAVKAGLEALQAVS